MSITVTCDREFLHVTGDVVRTLRIPCPDDPDADAAFVLALSDGTLIDGLMEDDGECRFRVAREGAGIMRPIPEGGFVHEWRVGWITIGPAAQCALVDADDGHLQPALTVFQ